MSKSRQNGSESGRGDWNHGSRPSEASPAVCGVLNVNKPRGMTSRGAVDRVARLWRRVKVGHAGTLDPLASGVLVVCVGAATRLIEYVQRMPKTYRTVIRLGARSDTLDADGRIEETAGVVPPSAEAVAAAVATQVGPLLQRPPEFSALKIEGKRAYDLARAGQAVALAPRPVTVHRIEILGYDWPHLTLEIECEGGTYIRSIARDIGDALGCGGLVEELTRTRIGAFDLESAVDPDAVTLETVPTLLRPAADALGALPAVTLTAAEVNDIRQGRLVAPAALACPGGETTVALFGPDGQVVGVGEADLSSGRVAPRRVLAGV